MLFTKAYLEATLERALKTFAQALGALLLADGTNLLNTDWGNQLSVAGMAALLSVLTSVGSGSLGATGPSLANEVISPPAVDPTENGYGLIELVVGVLLVLILVVVLLRIA